MPKRLGTTQYVKFGAQGFFPGTREDIRYNFEALPFAGNVPTGRQVITREEYIAGLERASSFGSLDQAQRNLLSQAKTQTGQFAPNYTAPGFEKFVPEASTPSEQYFTPEEKARVAAEKAGPTSFQTLEAQRVANIPQSDFEQFFNKRIGEGATAEQAKQEYAQRQQRQTLGVGGIQPTQAKQPFQSAEEQEMLRRFQSGEITAEQFNQFAREFVARGGAQAQVSEHLVTSVADIAKQVQDLIQRVQTEGVTDASGNFIIQPGTQQQAPGGGFTGGATTPEAPPEAPVDTTVPSGTDETPVLPPDDTATDTTAGFLQGIQASLDASRKALEDTYKKQLDDLKTQQADAQKRIDDLTAKQEGIITGEVQTLLTPFRASLEETERQRLYINENFQANQRLTNELDTLLTQGNALIEQQRAVTGLAVIRDPRIAKTISDVSARAGVLQAVMSARNGQIAQAYTMIDRSIEATTADRKDQLTYYNALLDFYEGKKGAEEKKLVSITKDQKDFLAAQIGLLENDMAVAQKNAENLKAAMTDPNLALAYAEAGVTLNDSPDQIAQKLASYAYTQEVRATTNEQGQKGYSYLAPGQTAPAGSETITTTDSKGITRTWWKKAKADILSVSEAEKLGVPFGTTQEQAIAQGITPSEETTQEMEVKFWDMIGNGIKSLQGGLPWGVVWNKVKAEFPEMPDATIDNALGISWREQGAFEAFLAKKKGTEDIPAWIQNLK